MAEASGDFVGASLRRVGVDLINIAPDTLNMASMDQDVDIDVNGSLELDVRPPRRSYQSHHHPYRPRAHRHEEPHRPEASTTLESPTATTV